MNVFKTQEGYMNQLRDNNINLPNSDPRQQLNNNLKEVYDIDINLRDNVYRNSQAVTDMSILNNSLNNLYKSSQAVTDMSTLNNSLNNLYKSSQAVTDMTKLNTSLNNIYGINADLSNNVYRKSDSIRDISNNLYDKAGNNLLSIILSQLAGLSTKINDINKKEDEPSTPTEDIKCIADFGTNIGDSLCCGQSGVLTNTKYVCPANYSKCESMKCGSKYGKCVKPS